MSFRIVHIIILCLFLFCFPISVFCGELYHWIDERGVARITDYPPDNINKLVGKSKFRDLTPAEIRQQEAERKRLDLKAQREAAALEYQRQKDEAAARGAQKYREYELKSARENLKNSELELERYQDRARNTPYRGATPYYEQRKRDLEKEVDRNRGLVRELEKQ